MQTGNTNYIYKNELDKACFSTWYGSEKRRQSDKFFRDKAFAIANSLKYGGYQRVLASMLYNFFDKKSKGVGIK